MTKNNAKRLRVSNIILNNVKSNLKEYIIVSLIFLTGIFLGVMFFNNITDEKKKEVTTYIDNYVIKAKENKSINTAETLKNSMKENTILAVGLWFAGTTLIGIPIVFGIILCRGFCIGYTISACTYSMGLGKGLIFIFISIFIQNFFLIPAVLAIGVSGIKLYKSVMKDKRKENIKVEILRHTVFSGAMLVVLIFSAIVKTNISGGMLESLIKYF